MNKIIIPDDLWKKSSEFLLGGIGEQFLFFLCGTMETDKNTSFFVRDFITVQDDDLEVTEDFGIKIKLNSLLKITNRARKEKFALIEAHSHPFAFDRVGFSFIDLRGFEEFVPFILEDLKLSYAATVWGRSSVDGICWKGSIDSQEVIDEIRIIGDNIRQLMTISRQKKGIAKAYFSVNDRDARQVLAIGEQGQKVMKNTFVAIVGLGGLGSQVVQQLTYLGVRKFMLVDFDKVQPENLNRIVGAGLGDLLKPKVDVTERTIKFIAGNEALEVRKFNCDLRNFEVLKALKEVDVIFGCVDRDGPRLVLNELAIAYMIPYIDSAFGINIENGVIKEAGGRVILVEPGNPCLLCCKEIDIDAASDYLASPAELQFRKDQGYISGADVPSPSIISLDGTIASIAVTEFLALVTGFKPAEHYSFYDLMEQSLVERIVRRNQNCVACSIKGLGDKSNIERYALEKKEVY